MKSKVEARKSVVDQCDYSRMNGKCGRALCENFGKPCPGRTCEDWKCDAEGTAVAVVEPKNAVAYSDQDVAAGITRQLQVIEDAEKNAQLERVKLGVVLIRWEQYLGDGRGRGSGAGLKGWLEENVPALGYETAKSYKDQAKKAVEMLGGGAKAQAVLMDETTVTQPDGEVIEIEAEYIEKRDKIFEDVKNRRQLEQTYFKFMASEGRGKSGKRAGISKGMKADTSGAAVDTTDVYAAARAVWSKVIREAQATAALKAAAKLLKAADVEDALTVLGDLVEILKERQEVLKAR